MARAANDGKGKPVAYELFPLALLRGRDGSDLYQPLNDEAVHRITQFYDKLQEAEKTINDDIEEGEKLGRQLKIDDDIARLRAAKEGQSVQFRGNLQKGLKGGTAVVEKLFKDPPKVVPGLTALRDFHSFLIEMNFVLLPQGSRLETRLPQSDSGRDLHVLFARFHPLNEDSVAAFKIDYKEFMKLHEESKTSSADFLIVDIDLHPMYRTKEGMTKTFRCITKPPVPPPAVKHWQQPLPIRKRCVSQCPTCKSTCTKELNHEGRHSVNHSNMIDQVFISKMSVVSTNVGKRKYRSGESAQAEICDKFCRRLGRGHTHIIHCLGDHGKDTRLRHDIWIIGKKPGVVLDEVTHDYYWEHCQIEDNCSESEKELFRKCDYYCAAFDVPDLKGDNKSFCQLKLWHKPLHSGATLPDGHTSDHGHYFRCTHYHVVLVVDKSVTMRSRDQQPSASSGLSVGKFNNRLGAALEMCDKLCQKLSASRGDVLTLITFDDETTTHCVGIPMPSGIPREFLDNQVELSRGRSILGSALLRAKKAIDQFRGRRPGINDKLTAVVIVLSDGNCSDCTLTGLFAGFLGQFNIGSAINSVSRCIRLGSDSHGEELLKKISSNQKVLSSIPPLEKVIKSAPVLPERKAGQEIGVIQKDLHYAIM